MIRSDRLSELTTAIDSHEDPVTVGSALGSAVKKIYREHKDVTHMLVAGRTGVGYCLKQAELDAEADHVTQLKKLAHATAFNTAVNCWPGWGDAGIVIEEADIQAGIELARKCSQLAQELALPPRGQGGAHWLIGALELAAGSFDAARVEFERAEQIYTAGETPAAYALMARGYLALARKADPECPMEGEDSLNEALARLRLEGSKDAIFFAEQIVTAGRELFGNMTGGTAA